MADSAFLKALIKAKTFAWASAFGRIVNGRGAAEALDSALSSSSGFVPVGTILPWFGFNGSVTVPTNFHLCDGSVVSDPDSPINGKTLPNLNTAASDPIFLGGYTVPGNTPTLVNSNLPTHTHDLQNHTHNVGTLTVPALNWASAVAGSTTQFTSASKDTTHTIGSSLAQSLGGSVSGPNTNVTGAPSIGDGTANQYPHHMKVTYIIRIK